MTYEEIIKRNKQILKLRENRFKLREIGEKFGITRERVRQIIIEKGAVKKRRVKSEIRSYLESVGKNIGRSIARELVRLRDKHTCQDCGKVIITKDVFEYNKTLKTK